MKAYRYLIPAALVALVLVQLASAMHLFGWHGQAGTGTGTGRDVTGRWTVAYVDAGCGGGCAAALDHLAAALDRLGPDASRVAPVFITGDAAAPRLDPRIARIAATPAEIRQAEGGSGDPDAPPAAAPGAGLFVVRRPNGAFAATIDGAATPDALAARLRDLTR